MAAQESWDEAVYEFGEVIEAGNDQIAVRQHAQMRGKASGAGVAWSYWLVFTFRHGRVLRLEWFADRTEAFEAAGLSEQVRSQENVEVARKVLEAWNRGDRDAWLALHDPEFEFRADPQWPESETVRGREAAQGFIGSETLLVNGGGIDGGSGPTSQRGDDVHAVGSLDPLVEGYVGCIVIRPDRSRVLAQVMPDPLGPPSE